MTFDPNVPQYVTDSLQTSQPQLQANFNSLFNAFKVNHLSLNQSPGTPGIHTIIDLLEQEKAIDTNVSEINIYTKDDPETTDQVFFRYQGNGQEFQFTNYQLYSIKPADQANLRFFTFLPGKVILYFGSFVTVGPSGTLNLAPAIAKNIITAIATVSFTSPLIAPSVVLPAPENGFYKSVTFITSLAQLQLPALNYLIMANI